MKKVNHATIIDMPLWCKIWKRNGYNPIPCKKNVSGDPEEPHEVPGADEEAKLPIFSEFGESCEELSWNQCTSTLHRSETNGIAERAVRRVKEGTSVVLLP